MIDALGRFTRQYIIMRIRTISVRQVLACTLTQEDINKIIIWKWKESGNKIVIINRLSPTSSNYKTSLANLKAEEFVYMPQRLRPVCQF